MGLQEGDRVIAVNGAEVPYYNDFQEEKLKYINEPIELHVVRDGKTVVLEGILPQDGVIGFLPDYQLEASF
jgi:regulator of sigma E protease